MKKLSAILTMIIMVCAVWQIPAAADTVTYIKSETAVLIEANTGAVLYDKNMNRRMYPASITKIMTALLALENCGTTDVMTASHNAVYSLPYNTSHIALAEGEKITVEQALYALGIESANDAANVIAEHISGSNADFGVMMTERARQTGAVNTNFTNPHGLPDENHYTTAYDMALITAEAIKNPDFCRYFSTNRYDMAPTNLRDVTRQFWNANNFINGYDRVEGLLMSKTGWTDEARHTLVTAAEKDGVTLIAVVMSSEHKRDKFEDTMALFDYGFEKYYNLEINADIVRGKVQPAVNTYDGAQITPPKENYMVENFTVTLPKNLTEHDLIYDFGTVVPNGTNTIASGCLRLYYMDNGAKISCGRQDYSAIIDQTMINNPEKKMPVLLRVGLWVLYIALGLLVLRLVYVVLRQIVILENHRRIKKRRIAMAKRRKNRQKITSYRE